jgi:Uma2 family endonuclease
MPDTREYLGRMTVEEYLAFEENSPVRHEYVAGEVFAMSGVTTRHNLINLNLAQQFRAAAKKRGCRVFMSDVMLRATDDRFYYPDLVVACGKAGEVERIVEEPTIVVEVTSPTTRATDRREKLETYQRMPTLICYLIVEQRRRQVFLYSRASSGEWSREEIVGSGEVVIPSVDARITLDEIYEDVPLPPLSVGEEDDWDERVSDEA